MKKSFSVAAICFFSSLCSLFAQNSGPAADSPSLGRGSEPSAEKRAAEPSALIGLTLESALSQFGPPKSVYAVRGLEPWQDDVVFEYDNRDLYVYKDRVWQAGLKTAYGISLGDRRAGVLQILGEGCQNFEDHILFPLPSRGWPLMLRLNLNAAGTVSAIFVYRSDF